MTMEYTTISDVFVPEVVGPIVKTYVYDNLALLNSGLVKDIGDVVQWNRGGNTVTFPTYTGFTPGSGSETLPVNGASVDSKNVSMDSVTENVVGKIIPLAFTNTMFEDVIQSVELQGKVIEQIGEEAANDIDETLVTEALTTTLSYSGTAGVPISYDTLSQAKMLWGDKVHRFRAGLVVHSAVYGNLIRLGAVTEYQNWGADPTTRTGAVPYFCGMPVYVSDNVTSTDGVYNNLIIAEGSLEWAMKREVTVKQKETPGNDNVYLDATYRWMVHLSERRPLGAIVYQCGVTS